MKEAKWRYKRLVIGVGGSNIALITGLVIGAGQMALITGLVIGGEANGAVTGWLLEEAKWRYNRLLIGGGTSGAITSP